MSSRTQEATQQLHKETECLQQTTYDNEINQTISNLYQLESDLLEAAENVENLSSRFSRTMRIRSDTAEKEYSSNLKLYNELKHKHCAMVCGQFSFARSQQYEWFNREVVKERKHAGKSWFKCGKPKDSSFEQKIEFDWGTMSKISDPRFDSDTI